MLVDETGCAVDVDVRMPASTATATPDPSLLGRSTREPGANGTSQAEYVAVPWTGVRCASRTEATITEKSTTVAAIAPA